MLHEFKPIFYQNQWINYTSPEYALSSLIDTSRSFFGYRYGGYAIPFNYSMTAEESKKFYTGLFNITNST